MPRPTDAEIEDAIRVLRADYYADVTDLAQDAIDQIKSGEITDYEALDEYVHESVDGTQRVIYTSRAARGLLVSDNDGAFEDMGIEAFKDGALNWSGMMYAALLADVQEELESEGYGYNGENWPQECEECGYLATRDSQENHLDWAASHVEDGCSLAAEEAVKA